MQSHSVLSTIDVRQLLLSSAAALLDEGRLCAEDYEIINVLANKIRPAVISLDMQTPAVIDMYWKCFGCMLKEVVEQLHDISVIETFLLRVLPELLGQVQEKLSLDYTQTLKFLITKKLHKVAHYLLDNHFCAFQYTPDIEDYTCLIHILFPDVYDELLFLKILAAEKHLVRHRRFNGTNALFMAATYNNAFALKTLLALPEVVVEGDHFSHRLFSVSESHLPAMQILAQHVGKEEFVPNLSFNELLPYPITFLSDNNQQLLQQRIQMCIENMDIFIINPQLKCSLLEFMLAADPLPYKYLNRLSIVHDCIMYLMNPALINQGNTNLCGPVCLLQHFVTVHPVKFVNTVIDLGEMHNRRPQHFPDGLSQVPDYLKQTAFHLSELWLETVRQHYNYVFSYSSISFFERFSGVTTAAQLARMYNDFGFDVLADSMQIRFSQSNFIGRMLDSTRKALAPVGSLPTPLKFYSPHHVELHDEEERFTHLSELIAAESQHIVILVSVELLNAIFKKKHPITQLYVFENSHYAVLRDFQYNPQTGAVKCEIQTYGRSFPQFEMDAETFKKYFLGVISVAPKQPEIDLVNNLPLI